MYGWCRVWCVYMCATVWCCFACGLCVCFVLRCMLELFILLTHSPPFHFCACANVSTVCLYPLVSLHATFSVHRLYYSLLGNLPKGNWKVWYMYKLAAKSGDAEQNDLMSFSYYVLFVPCPGRHIWVKWSHAIYLAISKTNTLAWCPYYPQTNTTNIV